MLLFHGLGQTHAFMETIANVALAPLGFASLACDARGTGASGGSFGLDGPPEVQDARDLFAWFAARSDVSDTRIGAFGLSMGSTKAWWLAALDPRICLCIDLCCLTDFQELIKSHNLKGHGIYYYVPSLLKHFQTADIN